LYQFIVPVASLSLAKQTQSTSDPCEKQSFKDQRIKEMNRTDRNTRS